MFTIGLKIRQIREERKISRFDFCNTESDISVRQLIRIENGESTPSLPTLKRISEKLGVPLFYLMPDYQELPERYKELKYLILRQPAYGNNLIIEQQERYLEEIFNNFYKKLPLEETLVVDYIQTTVKILLTGEFEFAQSIVNKGVAIISRKSYLTINDLSFLQLLSIYVSEYYSDRASINYSLNEVLKEEMYLLLEQAELFSIDSLFIYVNTVFSILSYFNKIEYYDSFPKAVAVLKNILNKTQDFQKKPLLDMLEWKDCLFNHRNIEQAESFYLNAVSLANSLGIDAMARGLQLEWKEDIEKYEK